MLTEIFETGFLTAFGFCDYGDPEAGLRAIRLLHGKELGDKALVVSIIMYCTVKLLLLRRKLEILKLVNYISYYSFFGLFPHVYYMYYSTKMLRFLSVFLKNDFVYFKKI